MEEEGLQLIPDQNRYLGSKFLEGQQGKDLKRRLHQNPTTGEIDICRWWLDKERAFVQPELIVTLGTSALRGVTGKSASIKSMRGAAHDLEGGSKLIATVHPSFLLRMPDRERAAEERKAFVADLVRARKLAA